MSSESNAGAWDRVAAELRACREAQQQAWGDIDNATLGRYLAGDISSDERRRVESALEELPELRKLMDLVGEVLHEFEPAAAPQPVVPEPALLRFPPRAARRPLLNQVQRRAVLLAAACLLLALGVFLVRDFGPSSGPGDVSIARVVEPAPPSPPEAGVSMAQKTSPSKPDVPFVREEGMEPARPKMAASSRTAPPPLARGSSEAFFYHDLEVQLVKADRSVRTLEKEGRVQEARKVVEHTAANVNRVASQWQQRGELVRAEPLLAVTHELCQKKLGAEHPETQRSLQHLARAYEIAASTSMPEGKAAVPPLPGPPGVADGANLTIPLPGETLSSLAPAPPAPFVKEPSTKAQPARESALALRDRLDRESPQRLKVSVVPVLTQALKKASSPQEREALARTLGHLGPVAREAVPVLTECLQKATESRERQSILIALAQMGPAAESATPALVASLRTGNPETRRYAAEAIVRMGPVARKALPVLNQQVEARDPVAQDVFRRIQGREGRIGVCDPCDCFSVQALRTSLREIHTLAAASGVEVLVETVPAVKADREADDKARELGVRGVFLLMSHDAPAVQVSISDALLKQGLTADRVRAAVEPRLREKDFDGALVEGVRVVARFEQDQRGKKAPQD